MNCLKVGQQIMVQTKPSTQWPIDIQANGRYDVDGPLLALMCHASWYKVLPNALIIDFGLQNIYGVMGYAGH